jgi:hypothetical protein
MKNLFLLATFLLLAVTAQSQSKMLMSHVGAKGDYVLFYYPTTETFYLLQTKKAVKIAGKMAFTEYKGTELLVRNVATKAISTYKIGRNIVSITKMQGPKYRAALLTTDKQTTIFQANLDDALWAVACVSLQDGAKRACNSGGSGSTHCVQKDGGNSCEVSCGVGYFTCCNQ